MYLVKTKSGHYTPYDDMEIWKDVISYEGLYKISSHGRVKSFVGRWKYTKNKDGYMMSVFFRSRGSYRHCAVNLCKNKKIKLTFNS